MGIVHEIWQVKDIKSVWVWNMGNIKVDLQEEERKPRFYTGQW